MCTFESEGRGLSPPACQVGVPRCVRCPANFGRLRFHDVADLFGMARMARAGFLCHRACNLFSEHPFLPSEIFCPPPRNAVPDRICPSAWNCTGKSQGISLSLVAKVIVLCYAHSSTSWRGREPGASRATVCFWGVLSLDGAIVPS